MTDLISREIRVFISSTFHDMRREREVLVKEVFPDLRRKCRERDVVLTEVDLRWGVDEEKKLDAAVDVCLREIDVGKKGLRLSMRMGSFNPFLYTIHSRWAGSGNPCLSLIHVDKNWLSSFLQTKEKKMNYGADKRIFCISKPQMTQMDRRSIYMDCV